MTTKKVNNTWVFYGQVNGRNYYFEDIEDHIHTLEESIEADAGIILWLATGDFNYVRADLQNEIDFQATYQEAEAQLYGEEITEAYITTKIGVAKEYELV